MRFVFVLFALWASLPLASANHISWLGDYDKAQKLAIQEQKLMMVLLVEEDCMPCNEMIKNVFMNHDYIDTLNQKVISVIVTKDSRISYPIELFYSTTFPILFLVDSKNETFINKPFYGRVDVDKLVSTVDKF